MSTLAFSRLILRMLQNNQRWTLGEKIESPGKSHDSLASWTSKKVSYIGKSRVSCHAHGVINSEAYHVTSEVNNESYHVTSEVNNES